MLNWPSPVICTTSLLFVGRYKGRRKILRRKLHPMSGRGHPATWPTHVDKIATSLYSKPSEICPPARGTREGHKEVHRRKHCKEPQSNETRKNRARRQMSTARMGGSEGNGNGNGVGVGVGETTDRRSDKRNTSTVTKPRQRMSPCSHQTILYRATTPREARRGGRGASWGRATRRGA